MTKSGVEFDAAVIEAERDLTQRGHFAEPHFVENLAGFGVAIGIGIPGLRRGKKLQHAARDGRVDPQHHQRRDDAVAPERRRKPRNAGVRVGPVFGIGHQHGQVGHAAGHDILDQRARTRHAQGAIVRTPQRAACLGEGLEEVAAPPFGNVVRVAGDAHEEDTLFLRLHLHVVIGKARLDAVGRGCELEPRAAAGAVEADIIEIHIAAVRHLDGTHAARRALLAACFEQVGEIAIERRADPDAPCLLVVVEDRDAFIHRALPDEFQPVQVDRVFRQNEPVALEEVRVRQVRGEGRIVVGDIGRQPERTRPVEPDFEMREMACVAVIEAVGVSLEGHEIALAVEHGKAVVMFQTRRPPAVEHRSGGYVKLRSQRLVHSPLLFQPL